MEALNTRVTNLKKTIEDKQLEEMSVAEEDESCPLLDLSDDLITHILAFASDHRALCAASRTCRRLAGIASRDSAGWKALCRSDFNCIEKDACDAPRMETCVEVMERYDDEVCLFLEEKGIDYVERDSRWKEVYRDRVLGWGLVEKTLRWLGSHSSPSEVSGRQHRFELFVALLYMDMCTRNTHRLTASRKRAICTGVPNGLVSVLALVENESAIIQELAASVVANLVWCDPEVAALVANTANGHSLLAARLDSRIPSVLQQVSRALATLWSLAPPGLEVTAVGSEGFPAPPLLAAGNWLCEEFSKAGDQGGEIFRAVLSFGDDGYFVGAGGEGAEEYDVQGAVDLETREWKFRKVGERPSRLPTRQRFTTLMTNSPLLP